MSNSNIYIRCKITETRIGFIVPFENGYKRIIVIANKNIVSTEVDTTTKKDYETYGDMFLYDNNVSKFIEILENFNKNNEDKESISNLVDHLRVVCNFEKYDTLFEKVCNFSDKLYHYVTPYILTILQVISGVGQLYLMWYN